MPRPAPRLLPALLLTALASLTACLADDASATPPSLEGDWTVLAVDGTPVVLPGPSEAAGETLQLSFAPGGGLTGYTGINRLSGSWSLDGDTLTVPPMATTKRAGPPLLMDQEQQFLQALGRAAAFHWHGDMLVLADADGDELLRLQRSGDR